MVSKVSGVETFDACKLHKLGDTQVKTLKRLVDKGIVTGEA